MLQVRVFVRGAVKIVHTALWLNCSKRNAPSVHGIDQNLHQIVGAVAAVEVQLWQMLDRRIYYSVIDKRLDARASACRP